MVSLVVLGLSTTPPARADNDPLGPFDVRDLVEVPAACAASIGGQDPRRRWDPCWVGPRRPGAPTVVLWGDSHAFELLAAVEAATRSRRVNLAFFFMGSCPPMNPRPRPGLNACQVYGTKVIQWLRQRERAGQDLRVVVSSAWELYHNAVAPPDRADELYPGYIHDYIRLNARKAQQGQARAFRALRQIGVPTDLVTPMPMVWSGSPPCARGRYQCDLPRVGALKDYSENISRVRSLQRLLGRDSRLVRPADALCDAARCRGRFRGLPVFVDQIHIGRRVSSLLGSYFRPTVDRLLRAARR